MADENPNPIRAGAANRLQALTGGTLAPSHGIGKPFRQSVRTPGGLRQTQQKERGSLVSHQEQSHATAHMARGGTNPNIIKQRQQTRKAVQGVTGGTYAGGRP